MQAGIIVFVEIVDPVLSPQNNGHAWMRQSGDFRGKVLAQLGKPLGRKAVRCCQRGDDVGPAQTIVFGNPDHVCDTRSCFRIQHDDGERLRPRTAPQGAHIRNAAAA